MYLPNIFLSTSTNLAIYLPTNPHFLSFYLSIYLHIFPGIDEISLMSDMMLLSELCWAYSELSSDPPRQYKMR